MSNIQSFTFSFVQNVQDDARIQSTQARTSGASTSWMMAFAKLMGEVANNIAEQMMDKAKEIDAAAKNEEPANELTAELTALSQLFKMVTEATSNVIKSIGEGNTSLARKQ
ncbi:MAG: hypothetical protein GX538_01460 [Gammaproteobacteria bacterium]|nr:hypothetical protein [Gammaproteobacteria bacterium]